MVRCGFPSIKIQSLDDHHVAGTTLQQPKLYQAIVLPHWANAYGSRVVRPRVGLVGYTTSLI
jgi:hypothetical protein